MYIKRSTTFIFAGIAAVIGVCIAIAAMSYTLYKNTGEDNFIASVFTEWITGDEKYKQDVYEAYGLDIPDQEEKQRAPLLFTTMTHMESNHTDDENEDVFNLHVQQIREAMDLFDKYGAKLTIESEKPFARANAKWEMNILKEVVERGHGVGTHCDIGFRELWTAEELAIAVKENKELIDALVGPEHNRGCSGAGGRADWAIALSQAGFEYINGIVGMHYLAMPLHERPDHTWTDTYIMREGYHLAVPLQIEDRLEPFMIANTKDFEADANGVILVSNGELGSLERFEEGGWAVPCNPKCILRREDVDLAIKEIEQAIAVRDPYVLSKITIYLPVHNFSKNDLPKIEYFLQRMQALVDSGVGEWATQGDVLDAYSLYAE